MKMLKSFLKLCALIIWTSMIIEQSSCQNTQYIKVGSLYPRTDYAGILINLNVQEAINRAQAAVNLASKFIYHHKKKIVDLAPWAGYYRHYNFLALKTRKVDRNLKTLKTDLQKVHEQYNIEQPHSIQVPRNTSRQKRSFNVDVQLDINEALSTLVDGAVCLFGAPPSLSKLQKTVKKIAFRTSRLESDFNKYTTSIDKVVAIMNKEFDQDVDELHYSASLSAALDLADDEIVELLSSINPLIQGQITHNILDPLQTKELLKQTQQLADKHDLQVMVTNPIDILKSSATTFATETTWFVLLSLPLTHKSEKMEAFRFLNIPWFYKNWTIQWQLEPGVVAMKPGLYPEISNIFIPDKEIHNLCDNFNGNLLCHTRVNTFPSCMISLIYQHTNQCSLQLAEDSVRYSLGPINYLFFKKPTNTMVDCCTNRDHCPQDKHYDKVFHGLVNFKDIQKCKIVTKQFTLLPQSTDLGITVENNKARTIAIFDHELAKVIVKFEEERKDGIMQWNHYDNYTGDDTMAEQQHEYKLFGTHTIYVHTILLFIVITIVTSMFCICLVNFTRDYLEHRNILPDLFRQKHSEENMSMVIHPSAHPDEIDLQVIE